MLHEGLGCVTLWRDFPDSLAAATGFPIFVYSRFGYGSSEPEPVPWPLDYMQREGLYGLPAILDAARIGSCLLLGHSDGASIALVNAGAVRDPRVRGVIVIAPHVFVEEIGLVSIRAAREAYLRGDLRQKLAKYHDNVDCAFWGWCDSWLHHAFVSWSIERYLLGIEIPILQIQGADDQYGTYRQLESVSQHSLGEVQTHVLPGCQHSPHSEQRAATLALILEFIAAVRDQ